MTPCDDRPPTPGKQHTRQQKRSRTALQLARKRERDRDSQRLNREKMKERMTRTQADLSVLRARYDSLLAYTEQLRQNPSCHADPSHRSVILPQYASAGALATLRSNKHPNSSAIPPEFEPFHDVISYQSTAPSGSPETVLLHSHNDWERCTSPAATQPLFSTSVEPPRPTNCAFADWHEDESDCVSRNVSRILLDAHLAIAADVKAAEQYPRYPTVANLLLIDVDTNPVIRVIGKSIQSFGPSELSESMAIYLMMYRLLRVGFESFGCDVLLLITWLSGESILFRKHSTTSRNGIDHLVCRGVRFIQYGLIWYPFPTCEIS